MKKVITTTLIVIALLSGCSSTVGNERLTIETIKSVKQNVTTKNEIFGMWGEPSIKSSVDGAETWVYTKGENTGFASGKAISISVTFDANDKVVSIATSSANY